MYVEIYGRRLDTTYSNFWLDKTQDIVYNGSTHKKIRAMHKRRLGHLMHYLPYDKKVIKEGRDFPSETITKRAQNNSPKDM